MMNEVRMAAVTIGWIRHRSCRRVGTSGPPRVPPNTTFVDLSTAVTHSPCYRPVFTRLVNLRQQWESLPVVDHRCTRSPVGYCSPSHESIRSIPLTYGSL